MELSAVDRISTRSRKLQKDRETQTGKQVGTNTDEHCWTAISQPQHYRGRNPSERWGVGYC